jgi:hypothetical protein
MILQLKIVYLFLEFKNFAVYKIKTMILMLPCKPTAVLCSYPDILPKDTLPKDILPKDILPKDILPNGHFADGRFAERTFCRTDICRTDIVPNG